MPLIAIGNLFSRLESPGLIRSEDFLLLRFSFDLVAKIPFVDNFRLTTLSIAMCLPRACAVDTKID